MIVGALAVIGGITVCAAVGYGALVVLIWKDISRRKCPRTDFLRGNMFDPHPKPSA